MRPVSQSLYTNRTFRALGDELRLGDVHQRRLLPLGARVGVQQRWDSCLVSLADARPDRDELHGAAAAAVWGAVSACGARGSSSEGGAAAAAASGGGIWTSFLATTSATAAAGALLPHGQSVTRVPVARCWLTRSRLARFDSVENGGDGVTFWGYINRSHVVYPKIVHLIR